jgi:choline dehydrogenase-like flavoprotein
MEPTNKKFDVIVVGSGPGGATVAREMSRKGSSVLILEWGDNDPVQGTVTQMVPRALVPGKSMLLTGQALGMVRGITTGGSSMYYCATAFDPPIEMLKTYGVDITGEVNQVREEVPNTPLSDELMSPAGSCFEQSALDLGYDCHRLKKLIYQDKCEPNCQRCLYGCPQNAKWNARNFVEDALENGAELINGARVNKVIVENRQAVGVEYRHQRSGYRAFADKIVIAAGGIGSPVILKNSGIRGVGYDFFFDPLIFVLGRVKGIKSGKGLCMCAGSHFPEDGIVITDFNLPHIMKILFDLEVFRFGQIFNYPDVVPIMVKVRDSLAGRVINDRLIWKGLTKADKDKLNTGFSHAQGILKNAGAKKVYKSWYLAAHPGGTVKIGEHVDANLQTWFDNLYVCDCSVIPEEWGLPPTMTLLGLGKRLSKHLMGAKAALDERQTAMAAANEVPQPKGQAA